MLFSLPAGRIAVRPFLALFLAASATLMAADTTIQENDASVVLKGNWYVNNNAAHSGGAAVLASDSGASATITFTGTGISWIGVKDSYNGIAQVYIDGSAVTTVDTAASYTQYQQSLYTASNLSDGSHTLQIVVSGSHSSAGLGTAIWIDAFQITGSAGESGGGTGTGGGGTGSGGSGGGSGQAVVEQTDSSVTLSGSWYANNNAAHSGGSAAFASDEGASAQISFTGTSIAWVGVKDSYNGVAQVYLDGSLVATVDTYAGFTQYQQTLYTTANLSNAAHTLKIVVSGQHSAQALGNAVWVDAFLVNGSATSGTGGGGSGGGSGSGSGGGTGGGTGGGSGTVTVQQDDPSVTLAGNWIKVSDTGYSGGSAVMSGTAGESASITFTGTTVTWIGYKTPYAGIAFVYLDGSQVATVDTSGSAQQNQYPMYTASNLANTAHTLKIVVSGTHNSANGNVYNLVYVDAFVVTGSVQGGGTLTTTTIQQDDQNVAYAGDWYNASGGSSQGHSATFTNESNATATVTFTGTGITWIGIKDSYNGIANVYVDGNLIAAVDTYAPNTVYGASLYTASQLNSGTHTFRIVVAGQHSPSAFGNNVFIDAFVISGVAGSGAGGGGTNGGGTGTGTGTGTGSGSTGTVEQTDSSVTLAGDWYTNNSASNSGGSSALASSAGDYAQITFTGTAITWIGVKDSYNGIANVYIDGSLAAAVDTSGGYTQYQQALYTATGLGSGSHTLKIVVTGTPGAPGLGSAIWVDAFRITP